MVNPTYLNHLILAMPACTIMSALFSYSLFSARGIFQSMMPVNNMKSNNIYS